VSSVNGDAGAAAALQGRADRPDYRSVLAALDIPALVCADVGRLSLERQLSVGLLPKGARLQLTYLKHPRGGRGVADPVAIMEPSRVDHEGLVSST